MINENFINDIKNGKSVYYLLEIEQQNNNLYLTSSDFNIDIDNNGDKKIYIGGHILNNLSLNNLEKTGGILIQLLQTEDFNIEELLKAKITIKMTTINTTITFFRGFVGSIMTENNIINITIFSNLAKLNYSIGQLYSPICRECLGSDKCKVNLNNYKTQGKILELISNDCFIGNHQDNLQTQIGYYKYGMISFLTGKLRGISMQIKDEENGKIYLLQNTKLLQVGDDYEIFAGCDKSMNDCKKKFNNFINFQGEPYIGRK